jgi:heme/copper-type cytochrome/quinol oxidase subunit 2
MKSSLPFVATLVGLACICVGVISVARIVGGGDTRPALTVKAVARQWWWEFDYPSLGIKTSDVLCLPTPTNL